jgi:nicotinate-nucleotide adenylyltransferase
MKNDNSIVITAIMGGTFDPVHLGHMSFAMDVLEQTEVQKIVFMPAKLQPFKLDVKMSSYEDRVAMLKLACEVINSEMALRHGDAAGRSAEVSLLENELPGVSYTYRTLEEYRKLFEPAELFFVTGTDSFVKLDTWMEHEKLLRDNSFIVGVRPGYPDEEICEKKTEYEEKFQTKTLIIQNTPVDMSATEVRRAAASGRSIEGMVTDKVAEYINEHALYSGK